MMSEMPVLKSGFVADMAMAVAKGTAALLAMFAAKLKGREHSAI
jgi:hypothetical protein